MIVAGVMSGTSADGINVALLRFVDRGSSRFELLHHSEYAYPKAVRAAVLAAMNAERASVADLSRLNSLLGELYAEAVMKVQRAARAKLDLVGCHGQTLYHQGEPATFLGRKIATTWQTGEASIIAARVGVPVISDFRPADMAAGGKGAPLVPFLDYMLFRDPRVGRIALNIGGIANLTAIPAGAKAGDVIAFDTGPGNMVIDGVTEKLFGRAYDRGGKIAAAGNVHEEIVESMLRRKCFLQKPPKTAGREEFGKAFVREFLANCCSLSSPDTVATATALTARSIGYALRKFVIKNSDHVKKPAFHEVIVSGGGSNNATLMRMLSAELSAIDLRLRLSDDFGLPSAAKEAAAFAVLAHETWHRRPSNLPAATGARRAAVLGKISFP